MSTPRFRTLLTVGLGAALTLVWGLTSHREFVARFEGGRTAVSTAAALAALLTAFLVIGRFRRSSSGSDLLLANAYVVLALGNLGTIAGAERVRLGCGVAAAATLLVVALVPARRMAGRATAAVAVVAGLTGPGLVLLVVAVVRTNGTDVPARLVQVRAALAVIQAVASLALTIRAERVHPPDDLIAHMAASIGLSALANLSSLYRVVPASGVVDVADILRLGASLVLLSGAAQEIRSYWSQMGALDERRRVARDLHDGLAQELAWITTELRRIPPDPKTDRIAAAAQRALDESRRAISALTRQGEEPFDQALTATVEEVARRDGVAARVDVPSGVRVDRARGEELLRIVREAVSNAVRHGHAGEVRVQVSTGDRLHIAIEDDGRGFDLNGGLRVDGSTGFGLVSMEERAKALGGTFHLTSSPGRGTTVEVEVPWTG